MKTKTKVGKSDIPGKPLPSPNIVQKDEKKDAESTVSVPHFEANSQNEGGYTRTALTFFSNDKGEIAWDRMRDGTKEELRKFVSRPDVRKNLGLEKAEETSAALAFGQDEVTAFFDGFEKITGFAASKIYNVSPEITSRAFTLTEDHRKKMSPVYIRLMNKWGPSVIKTWKDEIGATILTLSVVNSQIHIMRILDAKQKQANEVASRVPPRPVTPITPAPEPKSAESEKKVVDPVPDVLERTGFNL